MNRLLTSAALLTGLTSLSFGNLVANGGFEAPVITVPYAFYASGSTALTGWTVGGAAGQGVDQVNATNAGNAAWAHSGVQSVDMTGSPGPGSIRQDLTTTANELYDISFWLTSNGGPFNNSLEVYFDGGLLGTVSSPSFGTWTQHSFSNVVATGALTDPRLEWVNGIVR